MRSYSKSYPGTNRCPKERRIEGMEEDKHYANSHKRIRNKASSLTAGKGQGAGDRIRVGSRHAQGTPREPGDRTHAGGGGILAEGAWLQRSGRAEGTSDPQVPRQILGLIGMDARADHDSFAQIGRAH